MEEPMAVLVRVSWKDVTAESYDEARRELRWEEDAPVGQIAHAAWLEGGDLHIVDVWNSAEDFVTFVDSRLRPVVAGEVGMETVPNIDTREAHRVDIYM